jgi:amidase
VAAGIVPVAQAGDGGGSIRIPASCCGLVGLKTSRGRTTGEQDDTQLSQIAVRHAVSRTVRDSALLLSVTEARGGTAGLKPVGLVDAPIERPLRIAFSTLSAKGIMPDRDVQAAQLHTALLCERLGHQVVEAAPQYDGVEFENAFLDLWSEFAPGVVKQALAMGIPSSELSEYLEPWTLFLAEHFATVGPAGKARAHEVFKRVDRIVAAFMQDYDVWLTPVVSSAPPRIGAQAPDVPVPVLRKRTFDYVAYTPLANVLGTPAISLPLNWNNAGLPIGSMFMAKYGEEALLLQLAYQLEEAQPWTMRQPQVYA